MEKSVWDRLESSDEHLRLALESALDAINEGVWDADLQTGKVYLSPAGYLMLGIEQGTLPFALETWLEIVDPDDRRLAAQAFQACASGISTSFDIEIRINRFGDTRWIKFRGRSIRRDQNGHTARLIGSLADITERRQIEEELRASEIQLKASEVQLRASEFLLRESEAKYHILFQNSPDALFIQTLDGLILDWNRAANLMYGYSDDEFTQLKTSDLLPVELVNELQTEAQMVADQGGLALRSVNRRKNGQIFPVEVNIQLVSIQGEQRMIVNVRDITRHEQAQVELNRQVRFNEALLNALPNPVYFKDLQGRFLGCNPAFAGQFGLTENQIRGKTLHELRPSPRNEAAHHRDLELIHAAQHQRIETQIPYFDGSLRDVILEKNIFFDENGAPAGLIGSYVDITERKRAEMIQSAIYRISEAVQAVADLDELYREIHTVIGRLMQASNFYIALYDDQRNLIHFPYFVDEVDASPPPLKLDRGLTSYVLRTGKPLLATPEIFRELIAANEVEDIGADSLDWLGAPLRTLEKSIGVIAVQSYTPAIRYTPADLDVLAFISTQVALAIERKQADEQIRKLNRTLQTISMVNQVLVRAVDEDELMQRVCHILVQSGGYPLAWIGIIEPDSQMGVAVRVMAGQDGGYLDRITSSFSGVSFSCPVSALALKDNQPVIINNFQVKHAGDLWGEMARACGYHSAMVLPLTADEQMVGAIHVFSKQPDAYEGDEIDLLTQMADDLAFGITTLRSRVRHRIAEQALRQREAQLSESEEKYRSVVERANDGIAIIQDEKVIFANQRLVELWGGDIDDILGKKFIDFVAPRALGQIAENYQRRMAGLAVPSTYHTVLLHKEGHEIDVELNAGGFNYQDRIADLVIIRDISDRKKLEEERAQRLAELEAVNRISTVLRTAHNLEDMLSRLMDETLAVMNTPAGAIWLYDASADKLRALVTRGWFSALSLKPKETSEGIGGIVFTTGKAYFSRDFAIDPNSRQAIRGQIPAGWGGVCIPIYTTNERVGVFYLGVPSERELKPEEIHLLMNLAEIAGNAIYRERLHAQSELHVQRLNALHTFDMTISSSLDLRQTMDDLMAQVTTQLGVDAADVLLMNEHTQTLEFAAGRGLRGSAAKRARLRLGEGFAGRAALERSMVSIPDLSQTTLSLTQGMLWQGEDFQAYYCVPLIAKGAIEGVLEVFHRSALAPDLEWLDFLDTLAARAAVAIMVSQLFESLQRSNSELRHAYDTTIIGWSRALELRDRETKDHGTRVVEMTLELAREVGIYHEDELIHIRRGALLHDIGKMGVSDTILRKPGKLTDDEWIEMRKHPQHALQLLSPIPYLNRAIDIPYSHHEKWDGTGYPQGLRGDQIPISARIFAVIDVWDALTNDRVYSKAWETHRVLEYIQEMSGKQFDPRVVEAFLRCFQSGRIDGFGSQNS